MSLARNEMSRRTEYDWSTRINRAFTQRIYLMDARGTDVPEPDYHFKVMGNSGEAYDMTIDRDGLFCSCPDHAQRGNLCKHLMFVLIRAMGHSQESVFETYFSTQSFVPSDVTLAKCKLFLDRREQGLADINFQPAPPVAPARRLQRVPSLKALAPPQAPQAPQDVNRRPLEEGDSCPICCEDFADTVGEAVVWCRSSCGKSLHEGCFMKWAQQAASRRTDVNCVYCRGKWR